MFARLTGRADRTAGWTHGPDWKDAMQRSTIRFRLVLGFFIAGLVASGLTAFPLLREIEALSRLLGIGDPSRPEDFEGLRRWIATVHHGLRVTYSSFPFVAYGTDWLAFTPLR